MDTTLILDSGNTSLKAFIFQGDNCIYTSRFHLHDENISSALQQIISSHNPSRSIYASSGSQNPQYISLISQLTHHHPLLFSHSTPIPISLKYHTPHTLGLDRIAASVAASEMLGKLPQFDFMLVADAGTALTLDITDRKGCFLGGDISIGLSLRIQALNQFTAALPLIEITGDCPPLGYDTETALRSGAIHGCVAEISHAFSRASETFGKGAITITGGDADTILPHLDSSLNVILRPNLVADGLNRILQYNENIQKTN